MKVIFMGTPDFAVSILQGLIDSNHELLGVITQPDRPKGRGKQVAMPPIKLLATEHNIPIFQPKKVKDSEFVSIIEVLNPDIIIVAAFGQILSQRILDIPRYGCINVHGSLLPLYRGAAPIQWAIINNDRVSGVTIQQMVYALDEGDIILKEEVVLDSNETGGSLHDRLSLISTSLVLETLKRLELDAITRIKQDESAATYAPMLNKALGHINWKDDAERIECLIRGLNPWPSAYTFYNSQMLKIWEADVIRNQDSGDSPSGSVVFNSSNNLVVACGQDLLSLKTIQLQGKKRMAASDFLRGHVIPEGTILK
ncbi:MAG: methionyl-tRNA formyltransferase [Vallitaleaceae bacterium]|jgi:methionyl-tRNA formyltransferase|nr:methionyl-tRNA formyltransferase [Vallitaleaceae bacterium]